jgi:putative endonuclease
MNNYNYWVYILTNPNKTVLYTGVTNNLPRRLLEHYKSRGSSTSFAGKYYCYYLLWYEWHQYINNAIQKEKYIKDLSRQRKEDMITEFNPSWKFLNEELFGSWPPSEVIIASLDGSELPKDLIE